MKQVHLTVMPVRWGDLDAYGHVNNTLYFRYMEQARVEWLEALGLCLSPGGTQPTAPALPVVARIECDFLAPVSAPAQVAVSVSLGRPGRSSLETAHEIRLHPDGPVCARARVVLVWTDAASGRPVPLPDAVRAQCDAAGAPSA
ncbi:acyl-CoA thioesterase [Methyloversatilis sp.]|uniref:acyl-CoA thioesterase n=1 Tax=Methyloversatilis sp. TaxID=2569862 RepID=UPI0035240E79